MQKYNKLLRVRSTSGGLVLNQMTPVTIPSLPSQINISECSLLYSSNVYKNARSRPFASVVGSYVRHVAISSSEQQAQDITHKWVCRETSMVLEYRKTLPTQLVSYSQANKDLTSGWYLTRLRYQHVRPASSAVDSTGAAIQTDMFANHTATLADGPPVKGWILCSSEKNMEKKLTNNDNDNAQIVLELDHNGFAHSKEAFVVGFVDFTCDGMGITPFTKAEANRMDIDNINAKANQCYQKQQQPHGYDGYNNYNNSGIGNVFASRFYNNNNLTKDQVWIHKECPKLLRCPGWVDFDCGKANHVIVQVPGEDVLRFVSKDSVLPSTNWRTKLQVGDYIDMNLRPHGFSVNNSSSVPGKRFEMVEHSETKFPWTRAKVLEIKERGQEQMIRWVDCLNWTSKEQRDEQACKVVFATDDTKEETKQETNNVEVQVHPTLQSLSSNIPAPTLTNWKAATGNNSVAGSSSKTRWSRLDGRIQPAGSMLQSNAIDCLLQAKNLQAKKVDSPYQIILLPSPNKSSAENKGIKDDLSIGVVCSLELNESNGTVQIKVLKRKNLIAQSSANSSASPSSFFEYIHVELEALSASLLFESQIFATKMMQSMKSMKQVELFTNTGWIRVDVKGWTTLKNCHTMLRYSHVLGDDNITQQHHYVTVNPLFIAEPSTFVHICHVCQDAIATDILACHSQSAQKNSPEICRECMLHYMTTSISRNDAKELCCPFTSKCSAILSGQFIRSIDNDLASAYANKLKRIQSQSTQMILETDPQFAKWAKSRLKQCPFCLVRIEKNEGCDHMKCYRCGNDFKWQSEGVNLKIPAARPQHIVRMPTPPPPPLSNGSIWWRCKSKREKQKLLSFYLQFNPIKSNNALVTKLLTKYRGRETKMYRCLFIKYNVPPEDWDTWLPALVEVPEWK
jgi:hypothetical protein